MNSIKDITNQDLPDSSIRAQEIKDIYQKWWKYIDEWFWSLNFWKYWSIIGVMAFIYSTCFMKEQTITLIAGLVSIVFFYFYSRRTWYREGFYDWYDCWKHDAIDEFLEVEWVQEAVIKNKHSRKKFPI
jgi:uncharacterized membrane protein